MPNYTALPFRDKRRGRGPALHFWLPLVVAVLCGGAALLFAVKGDLLLAVANAVVALTNIAHLAVSPLSRPDDVARALRASRGVEASSP